MYSPQYFIQIVKSTFLAILILLSPIALSKTLNVVVGLERPPYVIQKTNSGYELELISQVITLMGYDVNYIYVPYGRSQKFLSEKDIDAITTMTLQTESRVEHLTDTYVTYYNSVITLADKNINIRELNDLKNIPLVSFHNAKFLLGKEYHDAVSNNKNYIEIAEQRTQVKLLLKERVHCIVIDKNIFNYFFKQLKSNKLVVFNNLFSPTDYKMAFKETNLVLSFNKYLAVFKDSEHYRQLQEKYLATFL